MSTKEETKLFDEFLKKREIEEKRKLRARSLMEIKREEEEEWIERMHDDDSADNSDAGMVDDDIRNEYEDIESHLKR